MDTIFKSLDPDAWVILCVIYDISAVTIIILFFGSVQTELKNIHALSNWISIQVWQCVINLAIFLWTWSMLFILLVRVCAFKHHFLLQRVAIVIQFRKITHFQNCIIINYHPPQLFFSNITNNSLTRSIKFTTQKSLFIPISKICLLWSTDCFFKWIWLFCTLFLY